jgi:hypothetical protein
MGARKVAGTCQQEVDRDVFDKEELFEKGLDVCGWLCELEGH